MRRKTTTALPKQVSPQRGPHSCMQNAQWRTGSCPCLFFTPPVRQGLKRLALYADSVKMIEIVVTPFTFGITVGCLVVIIYTFTYLMDSDSIADNFEHPSLFILFIQSIYLAHPSTYVVCTVCMAPLRKCEKSTFH